jgi:3-dehydroquinate synthase
MEYSIFIGENSLEILEENLKQTPHSKMVVLMDENTHRECYPLIREKLPEHNFIIVFAGEEHKSLSTCEKIWQQLTLNQCDRDTLILNLGGGVIGDMGGFVAGCYKRGVRFIQIPTTLLAQVDASVGAKTGIDFLNYKNQLGLFQNPEAVYIFPTFLKTLAPRQLLAGFAEVVKHYLIADKVGWLEFKQQELNDLDLNVVIEHSIAIKSNIVERDKKEKNIRKALNFGHTIGHAVESYFMGFDRDSVLHGEAVAVGIICEAHISWQKGLLSTENLQEITHYITHTFYLPEIPCFTYKPVFELMLQDKKNQYAQILCTLLDEIGKVRINQAIEYTCVENALNYYNKVIQVGSKYVKVLLH